jgi:hypothetical protein
LVVGAAKETAAQIRHGKSHYDVKSCFFVAPQADRDGSPRVNDIIAGFARGLRSQPSVSPLSYCFATRIKGGAAASRNSGRTPRRHQLRVFCATPSRKRHLEPVIGAVLHCMSELPG